MATRIGIVAPFDTQSDREFWRWTPEQASLHFTRTPFKPGSVSLALAEAAADLDDLAIGVGSIAKIDPAVITFACTSSSFIGGLAGERQLRATMEGAGAHRAVTTSGGLLDALRALGVRRVALGTPYIAEVGERLADFVREAGYDPVSLVNMELHDGADIAGVSTGGIEDLANAAMRPEADAVFLSCTGLETFDAIPLLEARLGVPVLSAIQVTMWASLVAADLPLPAVPQALFERTSARIAVGAR